MLSSALAWNQQNTQGVGVAIFRLYNEKCYTIQILNVDPLAHLKLSPCGAHRLIFQPLTEVFCSYLLLAIFPEGQPFISGDWYIGFAWGCCIIGFWEGPIRWAIIEFGGLDTLLKDASGCWFIPDKADEINMFCFIYSSDFASQNIF